MKKIDYLWIIFCISTSIATLIGGGTIALIFGIISILCILAQIYEYKKNGEFAPTNNYVEGLIALTCIFCAVCWIFL